MQFSVGSSPSQKEFIDDMELKMKDNEFLDDITALLCPTEVYDQFIAYKYVKEGSLTKL